MKEDRNHLHIPPWLRLIPIAVLLLIMQACMDDDALWETQPVPLAPIPEGVFIINEGNFMYGNASLSYYDPQQMQVANDVFLHTNGLPLGDVAISITTRGNFGYIVVNNSGRIYIIDLETFELKGKITGLTSPRYIHFVNDEKAYVSDLYARAISIINPQTRQITGTIDLSNQGSGNHTHSSEQMVQAGKYVFANSWSFDNTILVIDTETDEWIDTIEVPLQPQSMVIDKFGKLWVLTDGGFEGSPFGHEAPALIRIDTGTREIEKTYHFNLNDPTLSLEINKSLDTLFFISRHIFRHPVASENAPEIFIESSFAGSFGGFRGLGIDPASSEIYVGDALDFVQPGLVYRFSSQALPIDTIRVGIIPRDFAFKSLNP